MEEFVAEAVGTSPEKQALIVALVAAAIAAVWLTLGRRQAARELVPAADVAA